MNDVSTTSTKAAFKFEDYEVLILHF